MLPRSASLPVRGRRVLLFGLGVHGGGVATVRWLCRQGAQVRVTDWKSAADLAPALKAIRRCAVSYRLGGHHASDIRWAQVIVQNPDVPSDHPLLVMARRRGIPIINEASIFLARFPGRLIGITGTRGKTTTTLLLGSILIRHHRSTIVSGNVRRTAMLDYLPGTTNTWAVLELSSYQLEHLPVPRRSFRVAVMTNLYVDHLHRHRTMAAYARAKSNLFRGQTADDTAVLNADDPYVRRMANVTPARKRWFGWRVPRQRGSLTLRHGWMVEWTGRQWQRLFSASHFRLPGQHNLFNLLAATAAARALEVPVPTIVAVLKRFTGVPYRQELIRTFQGRAYINDTTATSPEGTMAALENFPRGYFILGGSDKHLEYRALARVLIRHRVPAVFLPGTATSHLQSLLRRGQYPGPLINVDSMTSAVRVARQLAAPRQPIILSPAAASFGLFRHEFDRGDQFTAVVQALR